MFQRNLLPPSSDYHRTILKMETESSSKMGNWKNTHVIYLRTVFHKNLLLLGGFRWVLACEKQNLKNLKKKTWRMRRSHAKNITTFNCVMQPLNMVPTGMVHGTKIIFLQLQHRPNWCVKSAKYVNIRSWGKLLPTNSDISYHKPLRMTAPQNELPCY